MFYRGTAHKCPVDGFRRSTLVLYSMGNNALIGTTLQALFVCFILLIPFPSLTPSKPEGIVLYFNILNNIAKKDHATVHVSPELSKH